MKKSKKENKVKNEKGITLIALVITIIVLLILAAVSIATLTGQNGILTRANDAKKETEIGQIKESAQIDILGKQSENKSDDITEKDLIEILNKYFANVPSSIPDDLTSVKLKAKEEYGGYDNIPLSEIYNGDIIREESIKPYGKGDVNYDGVVDQTDLDLVLNHINERELLEGEEFKRADINDDNVVDTGDLSQIMQYVNGRT